MPAQLTTLQKAKKILSYCQDQELRKDSANIKNKSKEKSNDQKSFSSVSKSQSKLKKQFSFSKSNSKKYLNTSRLKQNKTSAFVFAYSKQTRYDKIMRLKVKPNFKQSRKNDKQKKAIVDKSHSQGASREESKENKPRNKISRLQKIMQIKVNKPKVNSTLLFYEPRPSSKESIRERSDSSSKEWKECKTKIKISNQQEQKEDRLWKVLERERQLRCKLKKDAEQRQIKEQRRKEQRFQSMVQKQIMKIEKQRQIVKRKSQGFANYIYPFY